jgi:hypothetical protein
MSRAIAKARERLVPECGVEAQRERAADPFNSVGPIARTKGPDSIEICFISLIYSQ